MPGFAVGEMIAQLAALFMRVMYWIYVQAWPVGLGLIAYSLADSAVHNRFLPAVAGAFGFGAGAAVRFFRRYPEAWPVWRERWKILITRKVG